MVGARRRIAWALAAVALAGRADASGTELTARGTRAVFAAGAVSVSGAGSAGEGLRLELFALGRGDAAVELPPAPVRARGPRVERAWDRVPGRLVEWYTAGAEGLRQGVTIDSPPLPARRGEALWLHLARDARYEVAVDPSGRDALFRHRATGAAVSYRGLRAWDAEGRAVAARMVARPRGLSLRVDDAEATYPLTVDPLILTLEASIAQSTPFLLDHYAASVALDADTLVASAGGDGTMDYQGGGLYVYTRSGSAWPETHRLFASDAAPFLNFGYVVALEGDALLTASSSGLYAFARVGTAWMEEQRFGTGQFPGWPVMALQGDELIAHRGTTGRLNHFVRAAGAWSLAGPLDPASPAPLSRSLSLRGDVLAAGASSEDTGRGAVYVFGRSGTTWVETARLEAPDRAVGDSFGYDLAIEGDVCVVGAPWDDDVGESSGSAYVFELAGGAWTATAKLLDPAGAPGRNWGYRCDVRNGVIACSDRHGGVRLYARAGGAPGGTWVEFGSIEPSPQAGLTELLLTPARLVVAEGDQDRIHVYRDDTVTSYCAGKTNSAGCIPFVETSGIPSASASDPFLVHGRDVAPDQAGFLIYGSKKANLDFHGGKLCVKSPFLRTPIKGAKAAPGSCSGTRLVADFNQRIQGGSDPALSAGATVFAQWFQRDPGDPAGFGDGLTDAVRFTISP